MSDEGSGVDRCRGWDDQLSSGWSPAPGGYLPAGRRTASYLGVWVWGGLIGGMLGAAGAALSELGY